MNQNRMIIGLAVAVLVGLLFSTYIYRQFQRATTVKTVATQHIVVAAVPLQIGARVDSNNLRLISWPADEPVTGMFTRLEDCASRALITPVAANEPILEEKLAPKESGAGLSAAIPEGMRALTVAVNEVVGVAGFVIPGTMVDVLVTGRLPGVGHGGDDNITRTILENVRVMAAGQKIEHDRDGKPQTVPVITLLVSPQDAAKLPMASTQAKIQLALRNTIDSKKVDPPAVMEAVLFGGAVPAPATAPRRMAPGKPAVAASPPLYVIEVISGGKRENKTFATP